MHGCCAGLRHSYLDRLVDGVDVPVAERLREEVIDDRAERVVAVVLGTNLRPAAHHLQPALTSYVDRAQLHALHRRLLTPAAARTERAHQHGRVEDEGPYLGEGPVERELRHRPSLSRPRGQVPVSECGAATGLLSPEPR
jgi:hypothetical protein